MKTSEGEKKSPPSVPQFYISHLNSQKQHKHLLRNLLWSKGPYGGAIESD